MADQEKKAQWIMHLTVCLCGILILGKAVQAKLEGYARPGQYMLHRAVAFLAEEAGQLFLPAVTATEESDSLTQAAVGQMAAFFGWTGESEQGSYIEDEYTRQELIEAGRGGSLQEIQEENRRQSGNLNEKKWMMEQEKRTKRIPRTQKTAQLWRTHKSMDRTVLLKLCRRLDRQKQWRKSLEKLHQTTVGMAYLL